MSDFTGLFLINGTGIPRPVSAPDLAHWLALGRGSTEWADMLIAEDIVAGIAMENVWRAPRRRVQRPRVLGDGS